MGTLIVTVTVDWEGATLKPVDLTAMQQFQQQLPATVNVPITHFICPAYFTRTTVPTDNQTLAQQILQSGAIVPAKDEIAVHVHAWRSLSIASGIVNFINNPIGYTGWQQPYDLGVAGQGIDVGIGVPLGVYAPADIQRFLTTSHTLLGQYLNPGGGHPITNGFRCGAWVSVDNVFTALQGANFTYDASAVPSEYVNREIEPRLRPPVDLIYGYIITIWGAAPNAAPNYTANTQSRAHYPMGVTGIQNNVISQPTIINGIVEIPDTAMLAPFCGVTNLVAHVNTAAQATADADLYISFGFHQEGASWPLPYFPNPPGANPDNQTWPTLRAVYRAVTLGIPVQFLTVSQAVQRFQTITNVARSTVSANPQGVPANTNTTITVTVNDGMGQPIQGIPITLVPAPATNVQGNMTGLATGGNGQVAYQVTSTVAQTVIFRAQDTQNRLLLGSSIGGGANQVNFT